MESKLMIIGLDEVKFDKDTIITAVEEALEKLKKEIGAYGSSCKKTKEPVYQWVIKRKGQAEYTITDEFYTEREFEDEVLDEAVESYEKFEPSKKMNIGL